MAHDWNYDKPKTERKPSAAITIRCTPEERKALHNLAYAARKSLNQYCLDMLLPKETNHAESAVEAIPETQEPRPHPFSEPY